MPVSSPGDLNLETRIQQNGAPLSEGAMPLTPEDETRTLRCNQIINVRHGAAKPQNTVNAEKSAAKLWTVGVALPLLPSVGDGTHHLCQAMSLTASALAEILRAEGVAGWRPHVTGQDP